MERSREAPIRSTVRASEPTGVILLNSILKLRRYRIGGKEIASAISKYIINIFKVGLAERSLHIDKLSQKEASILKNKCSGDLSLV